MAYLYDPDGAAQLRMNMETLVVCPVTVNHWQAELRSLIAAHALETSSVKANKILNNWDAEKSKFLQICPKEMLVHIKHPLTEEKGAILAQ